MIFRVDNVAINLAYVTSVVDKDEHFIVYLIPDGFYNIPKKFITFDAFVDLLERNKDAM